jgi:hypothetical protein
VVVANHRIRFDSALAGSTVWRPGSCVPALGVSPRASASRIVSRRSVGQILVIVVVDLHHRRRRAIAHAFDLGEAPETIVADVPGLHAALVTGRDQIVRTAQHAGRRAADLHVIAAHGDQIVHGVEGRDLDHADDRHVEIARDILHHRDRQPALGVGFGADLTLGQIEQRHHRRALAPFGIARDNDLGLGRIGLGPGEIPQRAQLGGIGFKMTISH